MTHPLEPLSLDISFCSTHRIGERVRIRHTNAKMVSKRWMVTKCPARANQFERWKRKRVSERGRKSNCGRMKNESGSAFFFCCCLFYSVWMVIETVDKREMKIIIRIENDRKIIFALQLLVNFFRLLLLHWIIENFGFAQWKRISERKMVRELASKRSHEMWTGEGGLMFQIGRE